MVASVQVEFAGEMFWPGAVEVRTGLSAIGRTSFTIVQLALQKGEPRIYAQSVMVTLGEHGPEPLSDAMRAAYGAMLISEP